VQLQNQIVYPFNAIDVQEKMNAAQHLKVVNSKIGSVLFRGKNGTRRRSVTNAFTNENSVKKANRVIRKTNRSGIKAFLIDAVRGFAVCGLAERGKYLRSEEFSIAPFPLAICDNLFDGPEIILEQLLTIGGEM
jgi:hypothetical protein